MVLRLTGGGGAIELLIILPESLNETSKIEVKAKDLEHLQIVVEEKSQIPKQYFYFEDLQGKIIKNENDFNELKKLDTDEKPSLKLKLNKVLRINIVNEKIVWIGYEATSTFSDIKAKIKPEQIELDENEDVTNFIILLFKGVALNDKQ